MAEDRMALLELLRKAGHEGDVDFLQQGVQVLAQALMEAEVAGKIGADRYERAVNRLNGHPLRPTYNGNRGGTRQRLGCAACFSTGTTRGSY